MGILAGILCVIHCLAFPAFVALTSLSGNLTHQWMWLDYAFIAFAFLAVYVTSIQVYATRYRLAFWASFIAFAVGILLHHVHLLFFLLSVSASAILIVLHFWNYQRCNTP